MNNPYANPYAPPPFMPGMPGAHGAMGGPMAGPGMVTPTGGAMPTGASGMPGAGQLDPAMIQQILAMQGQQGQRAQVQRQLALAEQLRGDAAGQLTPTKSFRPGIANVGAAVLNSYAAKQMMDRAGEREGALDTGRQAAAQRFFDALRSQRGTME